MSKNELIKTAVERLRSAKTSMRCKELTEILTSLGFEVRDGSNGGHKIFVHHGIDLFKSGSFDCGHGANLQVKTVYVGKVITILKQYETELKQYLGERQ
jgi:hypothetical protein